MNHKERIARRVAIELNDGDIVNAGIGIPTMVPDFLDDKKTVFLHTENGVLGVGPAPPEDEVDQNLINAGKKPITVKQGAAYFDSAMSFGMIRGGHIDVAILGALEVSEKGIISNWAVPGKPVLGVGGAMDLLEGAKRVIITMTHITKDGSPKIVPDNLYPITSTRQVDTIITDLAVFYLKNDRLVLSELLQNISLDELKLLTPAQYDIDDSLRS